MKYLKIYENFMDSRNSGIAADLEAGEIENDQIYADMDTDNFGTEESQFGAEEILAKWEETFGDKTPTTQEKYDFYHDLRQEGFDGILIFDSPVEEEYIKESILKIAKEYFGSSISFNTEKTKYIDFSAYIDPKSKEVSFDFLGYCFIYMIQKVAKPF